MSKYWQKMCGILQIIVLTGGIFTAMLPLHKAHGFVPFRECPYQDEGQVRQVYAQYQKALKEKNALGIKLYLRLMQCRIGPAHSDISERYIIKLFEQEPKLSVEDKVRLLREYWQKERVNFWWEHTTGKSYKNGQNLQQTLAYPAAVIQGAVRSVRMLSGVRGEDGMVPALIDHAIEAGNYIVEVQEKSQTGMIPTPALRDNTLGTSGDDIGSLILLQDMSEGQRQQFMQEDLNRQENTVFSVDDRKKGEVWPYIWQGWFLRDPGNGGAYRDNAVATLALVDLYRMTEDEKYLKAARKAGDWARQQDLSYNFYNNGYNVMLLSELYEVTRHKPYMDSAIEWAVLGVLSGQYETGLDAGQWVLSGSNRMVYRMSMARQILSLLEVMPHYHSYYADLEKSLRFAVLSVEKQQQEKSGFQPSKEAVMLYCDLQKSDMYTSHDDDSEGDGYDKLIPNSIRVFYLGNLLAKGKRYKLDPEAVACILDGVPAK